MRKFFEKASIRPLSHDFNPISSWYFSLHHKHYFRSFLIFIPFLSIFCKISHLQPLPASPSQRLLSLDFLRGFIMVLLALESAGLYEHLSDASSGIVHSFFQQFFHHPWNGLRFWDLVQPAFMFMAGTAMAFSLHKQQQQGMSWQQSFRKILKRCFCFGRDRK